MEERRELSAHTHHHSWLHNRTAAPFIFFFHWKQLKRKNRAQHFKVKCLKTLCYLLTSKEDKYK